MKSRAFLPVILGLFLLAGGLAAIRPPANLPADSRYEQFVVATSGGAGTSTGTATGTLHMWGYVKAVHVDYTAGLSNTTDVNLLTASPAITIMTKSNSVTDAWYYPSVQFTGSTGAAVSGAYGKFPIDDYLIVSAAQSSTGTITVTVFYGQ